MPGLLSRARKQAVPVWHSYSLTIAKLSVSALLFDYVLTGPISGLSAGLYLSGLLDDATAWLQRPGHVPARNIAVGFALLATICFWIENTIGLRKSSEKAT